MVIGLSPDPDSSCVTAPVSAQRSLAARPSPDLGSPDAEEGEEGENLVERWSDGNAESLFNARRIPYGDVDGPIAASDDSAGREATGRAAPSDEFSDEVKSETKLDEEDADSLRFDGPDGDGASLTSPDEDPGVPLPVGPEGAPRNRDAPEDSDDDSDFQLDEETVSKLLDLDDDL